MSSDGTDDGGQGSSGGVLKTVGDAILGKKKSALTKMGWDLSQVASSTALVIPVVRVMGNAEAVAAMGGIAKEASVRNPDTFDLNDSNKQQFEESVVTYGIINSGSHQHDFEGQMIKGTFGSYDAAAIQAVLGDNLRRFYRAWANEAYFIMKKRPDLAKRQAGKMHMPTKWRNYAFDFADDVDGIPEDARTVLENLRYRKTATTFEKSKLSKKEENATSKTSDVKHSSSSETDSGPRW